MAAPVDYPGNSSSEDKGDLDKINEATIDANLFSKDKTVTVVKTERTNLRSKRPDKETTEVDDCSGNPLNTIPGFRKHISIKLSEALDSELDATEHCFHDNVTTVEQSNGVKLLASSKSFLQGEDSLNQTRRKLAKKRPPSSSNDSSSEDERLAEASVSHDFIVQQSNLPYLTNQKPADIVIKQADSNLTNQKQADIVIQAVDLKDSELSHNGTKLNICKQNCQVKNERIKSDQNSEHTTNTNHSHAMDLEIQEETKTHKKKKKHKKENID